MVLCRGKLRWIGHTEKMPEDSGVKVCMVYERILMEAEQRLTKENLTLEIISEVTV